MDWLNFRMNSVCLEKFILGVSSFSIRVACWRLVLREVYSEGHEDFNLEHWFPCKCEHDDRTMKEAWEGRGPAEWPDYLRPPIKLVGSQWSTRTNLRLYELVSDFVNFLKGQKRNPHYKWVVIVAWTNSLGLSEDCLLAPMIGENRQLVTNEPLSLRNNRLKFKTAGQAPVILEESVEGKPQFNKGLDLQTLGSQPVNLLCPKIFSITAWHLCILLCLSVCTTLLMNWIEGGRIDYARLVFLNCWLQHQRISNQTNHSSSLPPATGHQPTTFGLLAASLLLLIHWLHHFDNFRVRTTVSSRAMIGENQPALSYRWTGRVWEITGRRSFTTAGKLPPIIFRGICKINNPDSIKEHQRMPTWNRLDLQTLGSQLVIVPKNLPDHCL